MLNYLLFIALPYAALAVFIIGSIFRYRFMGFKVSSLSSQFLEGKQLFWGSQPFHWGMFFLFFGHLAAFLIPSAVLAWNGNPLRLIVLEVTGFAFGLSALLGLVLLIIRRLTNRRLQVVANYMDVVVYLILLVQITSGLWVAFFNRWGSSWFASTLTPYLRSIFSFDPQIDAVGMMPLSVQIHIVSAFLIVGIIPFTRFVHFLVYPVDYLWRRYQQVVWNWDRKDIRASRKHVYGERTRNN